MMIELGTTLFASIIIAPFVAIFFVVRLDSCACVCIQTHNKPSNMIMVLRRKSQFYAMITIG